MDLARKLELTGLLEEFGDPRYNYHRWDEGDPNYVERFSLTSADIPHLMDTALWWIKRDEWPDDPEDVTVFAPVHAWRALAQLKAIEAVPMLLEMTTVMDRDHDDWYLNEFPQAFGLIGPAAVVPMQDYLQDPNPGVFAHICIAHGLERIATLHPQSRDTVVSILAECLSHYQDNDDSYNACFISYLVDLHATEHAEIIERAFAANKVDLMVRGNWNQLKKEMGIPGLGLCPEHLADQRWSMFKEPLSPTSPTIPIQEIDPHRQRKIQRKNKKMQRQNRKKSRRR